MSYDEKTQKKINDYLKEIERHLEGISVSDRADILMELNSHISESLDRSDEGVESILKALGEPAQVANRYLIARGIQPVKPSRKPLLGKIALGVFGLFAVGMIALFLLIRSFFPLLEINEEQGRVVILGGMIDVDEKSGKVSLGKGLIKVEDADIQFQGQSFNIKERINVVEFSGEYDPKDLTNLKFTATNGKVKLKQTQNAKISYKCELSALTNEQLSIEDYIYNDENAVHFNFDQGILSGADCRMYVPQEMMADVKLSNGKIELAEFSKKVTAEVTNGKIKFKRGKDLEYAFNTWVRLGKVEGLPADQIANPNKKNPGIEVSLKVQNGKIKIQ